MGENKPSPLLEVIDLSVRLNSGAYAVDGVSFGIWRSECLAMVGESGCGKTLSALSLLQAVPPEIGRAEAGGISFEGRKLSALCRKELRSLRGGRISMIFQDPSAALNPLFTIGSQIVETIRAHKTVSRSRALRTAADALAEAGIVDTGRILDSYPHQLSGGQRQRAMIATALATEPVLLIADEPTTALDVTVQRQIIDLMGSLQRRRGLALLLITHNLSVVAQLADRVVIMYAGQIVESAPARELFQGGVHPYTRALFRCLPTMDTSCKEDWPETIPGAVPRPGGWPRGCRFRPRCSFAGNEACERPQELEPFKGRKDYTVRCSLAGKLPGDGILEPGGGRK
ncbi:MAG: ABC transporter ATP-binding protein [Gemmatimonadota bacterium]|nr:ABC transporter ATP-binding protein [Gemmatimonadota bacterium]